MNNRPRSTGNGEGGEDGQITNTELIVRDLVDLCNRFADLAQALAVYASDERTDVSDLLAGHAYKVTVDLHVLLIKACSMVAAELMPGILVELAERRRQSERSR